MMILTNHHQEFFKHGSKRMMCSNEAAVFGHVEEGDGGLSGCSLSIFIDPTEKGHVWLDKAKKQKQNSQYMGNLYNYIA